MKLKKIKNYILTFIICLLGAFAFNAIEAKAYTSVGGLKVSEERYYYTDYAGRYIRIYGNESTHDLLFTYYNSNTSFFGVFSDCHSIILNNQVVCSSPRVNSDIGSPSSFDSTISVNLDPTGPDSFDYIPNSGNTLTFYLVDSSLEGYDDGYNEGYTDGKEDGLHDGYDLGYTEGFDGGYDLGFDDGLESNNSLVGMVGAIFTGPVTMFQQIFNFNVLGINFAEMLLGLVTLLVVIWLIKKFI